MCRIYPSLVLPFKYRMGGEKNAVFEYAHLKGMVLNLDAAFFGGIGHRIEITGN